MTLFFFGLFFSGDLIYFIIIHSMGVIVWEVLCGGSKVPYDGVADDKVICRLGGGGGVG